VPRDQPGTVWLSYFGIARGDPQIEQRARSEPTESALESDYFPCTIGVFDRLALCARARDDSTVRALDVIPGAEKARIECRIRFRHDRISREGTAW
jgi:hypothetical protein